MTEQFRVLALLGDRPANATAEAVEAQVKQVLKAVVPVQNLATTVQHVRSEIRDAHGRLSPDEERADGILRDLASTGDVDFIEYRKRVGQEHPNVDAWEMLKALASKGRMRVLVQVVRQ